METITVDGYNYKFYMDSSFKKEMISYAQMAKRFMNKPFPSPLDIVGNYEWHEEFPYEKYLFFDFETEQLLVEREKATVVDFACGPGRMVNRAKRLFNRVDGIDISEYAIDYARNHFSNSNFFVSSGIDVGDAPQNYYDIVFSTIAIQHIPCKTIRENIFRGIESLLKPEGIMSIQIAYHPNIVAGVWSHDTEHASYESDFWNAKATNGHADMVINENDLPNLKKDLEQIYDEVKFKLVNVDKIYSNLNGRYHAPYWASDWLFIQAKKRKE